MPVDCLQAFFPLVFFTKTKDFFRNNPLIFSLIIFEFFLLLKVSNEFEIRDFIILMFIMIIIIYNLLYYKLNLEKSFYSFLSFFIWCTIIFCYFYTFFLLYKGLPEPILITDMTQFSQYRYLVLLIIALIGIFLFFLKNYNKYLEYIYVLGTFPYLKEEIKKILYTYHDTIWEPLFTKILGILKDYSWCRFTYIIIHFILFGILRFITIILFVRFIAFQGDLRLILYFSPIFFLIFLISYIEFYYNWFFKNTIQYMQQILQVELLSPPKNKLQEILFVNTSQFAFKLTSFGKNEGFSEKNLHHLIDLWFEYGRVHALFSIYFNFFRGFNLSILVAQILSWAYIIHLFFSFSLISLSDRWTLFSLTRRSIFPIFRERQPFQVRAVHKHLQNKLEQELQGSYSKGHLVIVDPDVKNPDNSSEILYGGQPTHGTSTVTNPSQELAPVDVKGSNISQKVVPPVFANTYIDQGYLHPYPISGSENYLAKYRSNLLKSLPNEENT